MFARAGCLSSLSPVAALLRRYRHGVLPIIRAARDARVARTAARSCTRSTRPQATAVVVSLTVTAVTDGQHTADKAVARLAEMLKTS